MRLSDKTVQSLKNPERGVKIYSDETLTGFGVRCSQGGGKAYVLTLPGAERTRVTIGKVGVIGLTDARVVARKMLAEETLGKHRPPRQSFAEALETFIGTRKQRNRPKTAYETERLLQRYFKPIHPMQLADIRAHHITDITDRLSKEGLQSTAAHAHTAAHTFLRFCSQRHYIPFNPIADLEKPTLPKSRDRILSDDELRTVWRAADQQGGQFGAIVKLLILTGQRRTEIGSLQSSWIECPLSSTVEHQHRVLKGKSEGERGSSPLAGSCTITLPSTITKNKRAHTFPLGALSISIVATARLGSQSGILFPARGDTPKPFNGWSKSKAQLDKKVAEIRKEAGLPPMEPWVLHDCRRSLATNWQRLGISTECIEAYLNHVSGTRAGIVGVYQRHRFWDEMVAAVALYEKWFTATILAD